MTDNIWNISDLNKICEIIASAPLRFLILKHLQVIDISFLTITKPLTNKEGETFCERLKWMRKLYKINGQKKPVIFSKSSKHFITELAQENSHCFILASFRNRELWAVFLWVITEETFDKSVCQEILLCRS